jgi:hypothetical protein
MQKSLVGGAIYIRIIYQQNGLGHGEMAIMKLNTVYIPVLLQNCRVRSLEQIILKPGKA